MSTTGSKRSREQVIQDVRTTRSKAASSLLMVYEYVTSRELKLLKNGLIVKYINIGTLNLGEYNLSIMNKTEEGSNAFTFTLTGNESIEFKSLSAKQFEAATVLTSEIPDELKNEGASVQKHAYYIEKFCVFLDSVLPIKLLLAVAAKNKEGFKLEVDELAALFSNMGESTEFSEMSVEQQINTGFISLETYTQNMSNLQLAMTKYMSKMDVVSFSGDGKILNDGNTKIYNLSGNTVNGNDTLTEFYDDYYEICYGDTTSIGLFEVDFKNIIFYETNYLIDTPTLSVPFFKGYFVLGYDYDNLNYMAFKNLILEVFFA